MVREQSWKDMVRERLTNKLYEPLPPKPVFEILLWDGLSGWCRAGLTLEGCSQLAIFTIQEVSGGGGMVG